MNQKGFTLVELLATVAILGILTGLSIQTYSRYIDYTKKRAYDILVESTINAMEEYLMDHPTAKTVTIKKLYEQEYLERPVDPSSKTEICDGRIEVMTNKSSEEGNIDENEYTINLCCANYNYTYINGAESKSKDSFCKGKDYTTEEIEDTIKDIQVLNVYPYPAQANRVKEWMDTYGKGIIHVTPVSIEDFNSNPEKYVGTNGNWLYDEIVFGFYDCNNHKDLSSKASNVMDNYLSNGGATIFGHDTLTLGCGNHQNFNKLKDYINIDLVSPSATGKNIITIQKDGIFTDYPYDIGSVGTKLTIPTSHAYGQIAKGDVWLTFDGQTADSKKVYLTTYKNNAFIQTGHSKGSATPDEQKIIANIIFYMVANQYLN